MDESVMMDGVEELEQLQQISEQLQQISDQTDKLLTVANQIASWDLLNALTIAFSLLLGLIMGYIGTRGVFDPWNRY